MTGLTRVFLDAFEAVVSGRVGGPWHWIGSDHDPALVAGVEAVARACAAAAMIAAGATGAGSASPGKGEAVSRDFRATDGHPYVPPAGARALIATTETQRVLMVSDGKGGWWPEGHPAAIVTVTEEEHR